MIFPKVAWVFVKCMNFRVKSMPKRMLRLGTTSDFGTKRRFCASVAPMCPNILRPSESRPLAMRNAMT